MTPPRILFILPTYGHFPYARRALLSFYKYTPNGYALWVDDASLEFHTYAWKQLYKEISQNRFSLHHFPSNGGLTRSWNYGLSWAKTSGMDYAIAGNSDILFTPNWSEGMVKALADDTFTLVGPVTNAPGSTSPGHQDVAAYISNYQLTDDAKYLAEVAAQLECRFAGQVRRCKVNGFFMMAKTQQWWTHAHSTHFVFNPDSRYRLVRNEDELQKRWQGLQRGMTGAVCDSFIFHYRAVTRGGKARKGKWFRNPDFSRPV